MVTLVFDFLRNCQTASQSSHTILYAHQQCMRVLVSSHTPQTCDCLSLSYSHPGGREAVSHYEQSCVEVTFAWLAHFVPLLMFIWGDGHYGAPAPSLPVVSPGCLLYLGNICRRWMRPSALWSFRQTPLIFPVSLFLTPISWTEMKVDVQEVEVVSSFWSYATYSKSGNALKWPDPLKPADCRQTRDRRLENDRYALAWKCCQCPARASKAVGIGAHFALAVS